MEQVSINSDDINKPVEEEVLEPSKVEEQALEQEVEEQPEKTEEEEVSKVLSEAGLSYEALQAEFMENIGFSEETISDIIDKTKLPRELIEDYVNVKKFQFEQTKKDLDEAAGGDHEALLVKAREELSFNKLNEFQTKFTEAKSNLEVAAVMAELRGTLTVGKEKTVKGGTSGKVEVPGKKQSYDLTTEAGIAAAMRDPAYKANSKHYNQSFEKQVHKALQSNPLNTVITRSY